jgi:hypothetical protein
MSVKGKKYVKKSAKTTAHLKQTALSAIRLNRAYRVSVVHPLMYAGVIYIVVYTLKKVRN